MALCDLGAFVDARRHTSSAPLLMPGLPGLELRSPKKLAIARKVSGMQKMKYLN